jgi:hypothetical protein
MSFSCEDGMPSTQGTQPAHGRLGSGATSRIPGGPLSRFVGFDQLHGRSDFWVIAVEGISIRGEASPVFEFGFIVDDDLRDMQVAVAVEHLVSSDDDVDREQVLYRDFRWFGFSSGHRNLPGLVPRHLDPTLLAARWGEEA